MIELFARILADNCRKEGVMEHISRESTSCAV
jgi:hypothetical protein